MIDNNDIEQLKIMFPLKYHVHSGSDTPQIDFRNLQNVDTNFKSSEVAGEALNAISVPLAVYKDQTDGKVYATQANNTSRLIFYGFVGEGQNVAAGATVQVITIGIVSGFASLTSGKFIYLTDTAGGSSHTPSTSRVIRIGIAVSATQVFIIQKGIKMIAGINSVSTTTQNQTVTNTITVGFKPRMIICFSLGDGGNGTATSKCFGSGYFSDSGGMGWSGLESGGGSGMTAETTRILRTNFNTAHTNDIIITIDTITETAFNINVQITGAQTGVTSIGTTCYIAFGE